MYLGVHGGRFIELVEKSWLGSMVPGHLKSGPADHNSVGLNAVETTPLVAGRVISEDDIKPIDARGSRAAPVSLITLLLKSLVWYLGGFPIWMLIAQTGKRNLTKHIHDLALKSPHPIRIGDVEYTGTELEELTRVAKSVGNVAILRAVTRSESLPLMTSESLTQLAPQGRQSVVMAQPSVGDINKRIGQQLLQKQARNKSSEEADPQQTPPSFYDFLIAVFFILFGLLAFTAGIVSLFLKNASK